MIQEQFRDIYFVVLFIKTWAGSPRKVALCVFQLWPFKSASPVITWTNISSLSETRFCYFHYYLSYVTHTKKLIMYFSYDSSNTHVWPFSVLTSLGIFRAFIFTVERYINTFFVCCGSIIVVRIRVPPKYQAPLSTSETGCLYTREGELTYGQVFAYFHYHLLFQKQTLYHSVDW